MFVHFKEYVPCKDNLGISELSTKRSINGIINFTKVMHIFYHPKFCSIVDFSQYVPERNG